MMEDRERLIEGMARIICKSTSNKGVCEQCGFYKYKDCSKFKDATALYEAGYGVTVQQWIPVTERLPEKGMQVWCYTNYRRGHTIIGFRGLETGTWMDYIGRMPGKVTHWMPLPEPPKEVE